MKSFLKLTGLSIQSLLYYRTSFFLNLLTPLIQLGAQYMLWYTLYRQQGGDAIGTMERETMFTYILVAFALNSLVNWSAENKLSKEIRTGTVIARCLRPVSFLGQTIAEMLGYVLLQGVVNGLVVCAGFLLFGRFLYLPGLLELLCFIPCMLLSVVLRICLIDVFSLLCFFSTGYLGITWTRTALSDFFSGALIPIVMFPGWLQGLAYLTPFPYMLQLPVSVLLGQSLPVKLPVACFLQIVWIGVFLALHCAIYRRARRNMSIAGG